MSFASQDRPNCARVFDARKGLADRCVPLEKLDAIAERVGSKGPLETLNRF